MTARIGRLVSSVLLIVGACPSLALSGQVTAGQVDRYQTEVWQTEDGLPENSATAMVQDSDGYLWFGTFDGLVRFDGVRFEVFTPETTPALPSAGVVGLHVDAAERLWVSTIRGLAVREQGVWRSIDAADGWEGGMVRSFVERPGGELLVTTFEGSALEFTGSRFRPLPAVPGERQSGVMATSDATGRWWVVRSGFVGTWSGEEWLAAPGAPDERGMVCGPAKDGGVWVVSDHAIFKLFASEPVRRRDFDTPLGGLWSVSEDSSGTVWICTHDRGLFSLSPDGAMHHWGAANGLLSDGVRFVFEDAERNLWIGTNGGGLARLVPRRFETFGAEHGLGVQFVSSVTPSPAGGMLVGTYGHGLFHLQDGRVTPVPLALESGQYVQSVLVDRIGRTWVGTYGAGLAVIEAGAPRFVPTGIPGAQNVTALFEDSLGRLWASNGISVTVSEADRLQILGEQSGLPRGEVVAFAESPAGCIWVSNLAGVHRFTGGRFTAVLDSGGKHIRGIACFKPESDGTVWMGSHSAGLLRYRDGTIDRPGLALGPASQSVLSILDDDQGFWWLSTNRGIVRARRRDIEVAAEGLRVDVHHQRLGVEDGLPTGECTGGRQPTAAKDPTGRLWFATRKGVATIDPRAFRENQVPPPVRIETVIAPRRGGGAA